MDIQQQLAEQAERDKQRELDALYAQLDFDAVASLPEGRAFLRRLIGECGIYRTSFAGEETHSAAYREGQRSIGLSLLAQFERSPQLYLTFLSEKPHDRNSDN
jgi:hypothetical protein